MSTALAKFEGSGVLSRIGTPQERQYLIGIMAEQLGIPASQSVRPDVMALLGNAAQMTTQYGWIPGIHMHVQKFEGAESKKAREKNSSTKAVYTYTLVTGEKAWKDSGARWRARGVNWRYQRKPMTLQEVEDEARLMGFTDKLTANSFGIWSRIIMEGDDPKDDFNPMWSAGVYFGKIKAGNFWKDDPLPSGVSARDVAWRRADKRAMMQSELTLLPVDDLGTDQRIAKLVDHLRTEAQVQDRLSAPPAQRQLAQVEDDGDVLWAVETPAKRPAAVVDEPVADMEIDARPGDDDVNFYRDQEPPDEVLETDARPAPEPPSADARPAKSDARPLNDGPEACPSCHAPAGKPHANRCKVGKAATAPADARPAEPVAQPEPTPADARPASPIDRMFKEATEVDKDQRVSKYISTLIRRCRNADKDSTSRMDLKSLDSLTDILSQNFDSQDGVEFELLLAALLGYRVTESHLPGLLVHGFIAKPLRANDLDFKHALMSILAYCQEILFEYTGGGE